MRTIGCAEGTRLEQGHAGVRRAQQERRGRVCAAGTANAEGWVVWGDGAVRGLPRRRRRPKHTDAKRRGRLREAHAAAHPRSVPVDAPSKADLPLELRHVVGRCSIVHGLTHRVDHRVRRASYARSDTCGFEGGTRAAPLTLERRRRALRAAVRAGNSPAGPTELVWRRQPWREGATRMVEATTARSRGRRNAWLPRPRAGGMGVRSSWRSEAPDVCEAGHHRARPRSSNCE